MTYAKLFPAGQNATDGIQIQCHGLVFNQTAPAFQETHEFVVIVKTPFRTTARITAFRPGQSPPPVNIPIRIVCSSSISSG